MKTRKDELKVLIENQRRELSEFVESLVINTNITPGDTHYIKQIKECITQLESYIIEYNAVKYKNYPNDTN